MKYDYDTIIVGSGCAGASAGFFLKHLDPERQVLMLERLDDGRYARYHRMCGETISGMAFHQLRPLEPEAVVHHIHRIREVWPGGTNMDLIALGYVLNRPEFLHRLIDRYRSLGGETEQVSIVAAVREGDGFRITDSAGHDYSCKHLIGADGAHSLIRRQLFGEEPQIMLWVEQYIIDRKIDGDTIQFIQNERYQGGYRWEFPAGRYMRIGFPRGTDTVEGDIIEKHQRAIPAGGLKAVRSGGALLAGDAAAMTNALTGGGIRVALLSGRRAAEAIVSGHPEDYQRWWSSSPFATGPFLKAFRLVQSLTNTDLERVASPFRKGVGALSYLGAWLSRPEFRPIYSAYRRVPLYGW